MAAKISRAQGGREGLARAAGVGDSKKDSELSNKSQYLDIAKLHPQTLQALKAAGWTTDRMMDVELPLETLKEAGFSFNAHAESVISTLYGLRVHPVDTESGEFINDDPLILKPELCRRHRSAAELIQKELGGNYVPLGWWLSSSYVFMEDSGRVVGYLGGLVWRLGESVEDALNLMVRADRPLVCGYVRPGRTPWPR